MYTKPVGTICLCHGLFHHFYADDSQLYISFKPIDSVSKSEALRCIECYRTESIAWMNANMLKLNADKTEVMLFSIKHKLRHVENVSIMVGESAIGSKDY